MMKQEGNFITKHWLKEAESFKSWSIFFLTIPLFGLYLMIIFSFALIGDMINIILKTLDRFTNIKTFRLKCEASN